MLTVYSHARAEVANSPWPERNHAKKRSYVALLSAGQRGCITRKFVERNRDGNLIHFAVAHQPGDIYEIRRWLWSMERQIFIGGTDYIGFDEANRPFALSRDEAFASVTAQCITTTSPPDRTPAPVRIERMLPQDIQFS